MPPEMHYVVSSLISSVGYDPSQRALYIQFHSGDSLWRYFGVSETVYHEIMAAASPGSYYHKHVKKMYQAEKVEG